MSYLNKVILLGRLGRDPEVKYLDNQRCVATFSLATSESYKDKSGQRIEQTEWHDIELWEDLAKLAEKYLKKGNMVYIEGKIRSNHWKDKEGNERTTKRIRGTSITLWSSGNPGGGQNQGTSGTQGSQEEQPKSQGKEESNTVEMNDTGADDLPF